MRSLFLSKNNSKMKDSGLSTIVSHYLQFAAILYIVVSMYLVLLMSMGGPLYLGYISSLFFSGLFLRFEERGWKMQYFVYGVVFLLEIIKIVFLSKLFNSDLGGGIGAQSPVIFIAGTIHLLTAISSSVLIRRLHVQKSLENIQH